MVILPALFAPFTIVLDSVLQGVQYSRWLCYHVITAAVNGQLSTFLTETEHTLSQCSSLSALEG